MNPNKNIENSSLEMGKAIETLTPFNIKFPHNTPAERYAVLKQVFYLTDEELDWLRDLARQLINDNAKTSQQGC